MTISSGRKPIAIQTENQKGDDRREDARHPQRHAEEQVETKRRTQELGQVGRHGHDFHHDPHHQDDRARKMDTALVRQAQTRGDAKLGRERLQQHGHDVAGHDHPEQRVAVLGATLDVGGKIARVHVGHAGNKGRPHEREQPRKPVFRAFPGQHLIGGSNRADVAPAFLVTLNWFFHGVALLILQPRFQPGRKLVRRPRRFVRR